MRVLITGVLGMDGSHLAEILTARGDDVFGMIRDPDAPRRNPIPDAVQTVVADLGDYDSLRSALRAVKPEVVYHLAAMSSPEQAWRMPGLCLDVTGAGTRRLLDAAGDAQVIVAGTIANHGPYGAAKQYAADMARDARRGGYRVTTVHMGGHHSPRRGGLYLSAKVARHAAHVSNLIAGGADLRFIPKLQLGWLGRVQDWGWAPDFMAVWSRLHELDPDSYTLSTNHPIGVSAYVAECYAVLGLQTWVTHESAPGGEVGQPTDVPRLTAMTSPQLRELTRGLPSFDDPERFFFKKLVPNMVNAYVRET